MVMALYAGSNFILVPVLLKVLGERNFGIYMMLYSIAQYMSIGVGWLGGVGIRLIGVYEAKRDYKKLQEIIMLVFYYFLIYGVIIFIGFGVFGLVWGDNLNLKIAIFIFGAYLLFNYMLQAIVNILFSLNRQVISNILKSIPVIFYTLFAIFFLKYWRKDIISPVVALLLSVFIMIPIVIKEGSKLRCFGNPLNIEKQTVKEAFFSVGLWNFLCGLFSVSLVQDKIFLGIVVSPEAVAKFTVLWTIPNFLILLLQRISGVLQPYFVRYSEKNIGKLKKVFLKNLGTVITIAFIFSLVYSFFGERIIQLWIGKSIRFSSHYAFLIAGLLILFLATDSVFSSFVFSVGKFKNWAVILMIIVFSKYIIGFILSQKIFELSTLLSSIVSLPIGFILYLMIIKRYLYERSQELL